MPSLTQSRSFSLYQQSTKDNRFDSASFSSGLTAATMGSISHATMTTTNSYNAQFNGFLNKLNTLRASDAQQLNLSSPNQSARSVGVKRAWQYERADIEMGGKGSANWNTGERAEILEKGTVRGAEGHHQKNVADHPDEQANPDNIKFYKNRAEHLQKGHSGDWHNESDKPMTDKNKMLKRTNSKRVIRNELTGLGLAVAVGAGVGLTIGVITSLAQTGVTPDSLKIAAIAGAKSGIESGITSMVGYGIGRTVGDVATQALTGIMENVGITVTENITKMISMGTVGTLTILVASTYQFVKMKMNGVATKDAMVQTGKQALFSISLLAVSIAAQGIWGGAAGIIVSVSIGIIMISYTIGTTVHQRHFADEIRVYTIKKCYPVFSV